MKTNHKIAHRLAAIALACAATSTSVLGAEFETELRALAQERLAAIAQDPILLKAVAQQNAVTNYYNQNRIDELDNAWRTQVNQSERPLIDQVMRNPASEWLQSMVEQSDGLYTEIFVMDAVGLNVAQASVTSDYWQGDEDKWQQSFSTGGIHIGEVEQDESTQVFQSQVSLPVVDPQTNSPIGAITVGIDLSLL